MNTRITFLTAIILVIGAYGLAGAEEISLTLDHVVGEIPGDRLAVDTDVEFHLRITVEGHPGCAILPSIGLQVFSEDGAEWDTTIVEYFPFVIDTVWYDPIIVDTTGMHALFNQFFLEKWSMTGSGADTVGFVGITYGEEDYPGLYDGLDTTVLIFRIHPTLASHRKHICLDLAANMPGFEWEWSALGLECDLEEFTPSWSGPHCYQVFDSTASDPSSLVISEDTLYFTSVQGAGNPPAQQFNVNSDLDPLDFTLSDNSSWLLQSPNNGTTPQAVTVSINNFALTQGVYFDSIMIESPLAVNSPQWVYVGLTVEPPPPEIGVSTTDFFFAAVVDGANPDDQYLDISNLGGSVLNWTVSNSESWLSLDPLSGTDAGTVTLSIDVTGLAIGNYFDTIWVSDPNAVNDPVGVEVWLSVASGLPEIAVDPQSFYVVVDLTPGTGPGGEFGPDPLDVPPVNLMVYNGGGGVMNFWIVENSGFISSVTPDAGGVPQDVQIEFEFYESTPEGNYFDTVWVYSDEATNSPFPVPIAFHVRTSPAEIAVDHDYIVLDMYQCQDGTAQEPPIPEFTVTNIGGEAMVVQLMYESEFFETYDYSSGIPPATYGVSPLGTEAAPGTYFDTIWVTALNAVNSPYPVVVECNILPTTDAPEIGYYTDRSAEGWVEPAEGLVFAVYNDGHGAKAYNGCWILNKNFGCMDWELTGGPAWAVPSHLMGSTPHHISFLIDPTGYAPGTYVDTLVIESPSAINSPRKVPMTMHVWELYCDMNFDGLRNLSDIARIIDYVFLNGPEPFPEMQTANCDCMDETGKIKITLSDITHLIAFVFQRRPNPCLGGL